MLVEAGIGIAILSEASIETLHRPELAIRHFQNPGRRDSSIFAHAILPR